MYFINNSGHLFELPEYSKEPIGYEYNETNYIFWLDHNNQNQLSINNYYGKVINLVYELDIDNFSNINISDILDIDITLDSQIYSLIPANIFQKAIHENQSLFDIINPDKNNFNQYDNYISLNNTNEEYQRIQYLTSNNEDDIIIIKTVEENNKQFIIIPLYIIAKSKDVGTFISNILVHIKRKFSNNEIWCPISVGGIFLEQYEELVIHGKNMGVDLPKDIIKAIWGTSYWNDEFDEQLYNKKLKEYMLNYMGIKGELGNYNSALNGIKWFGYYDKIQISKLIQTDNEFKSQFIRDYFDINTDLIYAYHLFVNNSLISLNYKIYQETGKLDYQNIQDNKFWGEGNPLLTSIIPNYKIVNTSEILESQQYGYLNAFQYTLNELLLKLSCLSYYYQKYFLPIFLVLKSWAIEDKVYENAKKQFTYSEDHYYEKPILNNGQDLGVTFDKENIRYFTHQIHWVDEMFNEYDDQTFQKNFTNLYDESNKGQQKYDRYLINDSCINIPIYFPYDENNLNKNYYNCLLFIKDVELDIIIYNSRFSFIQTDSHKYKAFILYPKLFNHLYKSKILTCINRKYKLYLNVNNFYYTYEFIIKTPEFDVKLGTLEYKYWCSGINYINNIYNYFNNEYSDLLNTTSLKPKVTFNYINDNITLDITEYIQDYDWFDEPSKYISNFTQINDIIEDPNDEQYGVQFNSYMHYPDFINLNDIEFGTDLDLQKINKIVNNHKEQIQLQTNDKYLNIMHVYQLYQSEDKRGLDILMFKQNLSMLCQNVLFTKNLDNNSFNIEVIKKTDQEETTTNENITNDISEYFLIDGATLFDGDNLLENNNLLNESHVYYFILKRNKDGNIVSDNENNVVNDSSLYNFIENKNKKHNIGILFYKLKFDKIKENNVSSKSNLLYNNLEDFIDISLDFQNNLLTSAFTINSNYNILNLSYINNKFMYKYNGLLYNIKYTIQAYQKTINNSGNVEFNEYIKELDLSSMSDEEINYLDIYIGLNIYFYEYDQILNFYGYYNDKYCINLHNDEEDTDQLICDIKFNDDDIIYKNVKLYKSNYVEYTDQLYNVKITSQNPSMYWHTIDDFPKIYNNEYTKKTDYTYSHDLSLNNYDIAIINDSENIQEIKYTNYLCKNLVGYSGKYELSIDDISSSNNGKVYLCIDINNNGNITTYSVTNNESKIFTLTGNETQVLVYFKVNTNNNGVFSVYPHLYKINNIDSYIEYDNTNNSTESLINLYKQFFYKKYEIDYHIPIENNPVKIPIKKIWDSYIQYNNEQNYDTYLMHGPISQSSDKEYWYIVFISKYTANKYNYELYNTNKTINYTYIDPISEQTHNYILKHISSKKIFLINRMDIKYEENVNHFNKNDMIVCSLENNKMLPTNINLSSKWEIKPLSWANNYLPSVYSNSNIGIISLQENDNKYAQGYYELIVRYSLDQNLINTRKIVKKLLVK